MKQITAYFQNFPEDTYLISSLYYIGKKRNLKKTGLLLHTSDNWVVLWIVIYQYVSIYLLMVFYTIWSDSRLCFQFLLHCSIEIKYKKVFYKYLYSRDSYLGSIYLKGNTKISYTKLVSASCIFKWKIGHKTVEIILS